MRLLNCPKPESLLQLVSVPEELSAMRRAGLRLHKRTCATCSVRFETIRRQCEAYFNPTPDLTPSLLRVYARLQRDETLILKGWKLSDVTAKNSVNQWLVSGGWLFRGGISVGVAALFAAVVLVPRMNRPAEMTTAQALPPRAPFAQIRIQDRNSVKVHYVQPELLQSMEFETTSAR